MSAQQRFVALGPAGGRLRRILSSGPLLIVKKFYYIRFGRFTLDLTRELMPLDYDLPILSTPPGQEAPSAAPR